MIAEVRVTTCTERRDGYIKQALLLSAVAFEPGEGISLSFEDQGILPEKLIPASTMSTSISAGSSVSTHRYAGHLVLRV
ncbi:hypothetical protein Plhal703r1_c49g0153361 [Plasmopara halstedii]